MHCVLVFDHLNDIVFYKCDRKFIQHIKKLEHDHKFTSCENEKYEDDELDINVVIQIFSPIVTSQRIMSSQFGNSYTSIQSQDGINIVFDEYMGFLFVNLGFEDVQWLKRMLGICISIVQHLCGPDVSVLKFNESRNVLVQRLLDTWSSLVSNDQAVLLEALEQLFVNPDVNNASIKTLKDSTDRIKTLLDYSKSHGLLFVQNKFLSLYSSKSARELNIGDLLFLSLISELHQTKNKNISNADEVSSLNKDKEEHYVSELSPDIQKLSNENLDSSQGSVNKSPLTEAHLYSDLILLSGNNNPALTPYIMHVSTITEGVSLILLYQTQWETLNSSLNDAFESVSTLCSVSYTEKESMKRAMDRLEIAMKRILDLLKKIKPAELSPKLDACIKVLHVKWDLLKKQCSDGHEVSLSSCSASLGLCLRDLLSTTVLNTERVDSGKPAVAAIARCVLTALSHFTDFLKVKALTNFTLGSRGSLSINKYLEEFPGLVHFLYVDRINHRVITPSLQSQLTNPPLPLLNKEKIWSMVEFSRLHLQEGHLAIMWKDGTFNYAYYLWFEDSTGSALKPKVSPSVAVKALPIPGVFSGDFYQRLIDLCFPKTSPGKVRCYELYCIHLGLATSSCVLEQSRRIAATICEVTGVPNNPLDLL